MAGDDSLSLREQAQQEAMMNAREQQLRKIAACQRQPQAMGGNRLIHHICGPYDDLTVEPIDFGSSLAPIASFEASCQYGPLSAVQSIVLSSSLSQFFLHHGLVRALNAGQVEIASWVLSMGAPLVRQTPKAVLLAPLDQQIPLFELLTDYGWTPDTPGYYGAVLLPRVVTNLPLLTWFLDHGANPNLGRQRYSGDRMGGPDTDSCDALEEAARRGTVETVRMLLDAGAELKNGSPLHSAASVRPPGTDFRSDHVTPSKEFDTGRIPILELLVERGADVNEKEKTRYVTPGYPLKYAVMAGAVERVKWLLEKGADPEVRGPWGSAIDHARLYGSEDMKRVINSARK